MNNLLEIWKEQPKGYLAVSSKTKGKWEDFFFKSVEEVYRWIKERRKSSDLYFCTTTLKNPQRVKENVQASRYLWQDLDAVDPRKLPPELKPTIAWESSPKRFQAIWQLNTLYSPDEIEKINHNLALTVKADKGSWILTKVLRIPGTLNFKYNSKPEVKLLWTDGPIYNYRKLQELLVDASSSGKAGQSDSPGIDKTGKTAKEILKAKWKILPTKLKKLLAMKKVSPGKRSDTLWYLEHELIKLGFSIPEVYQVIKESAWNKYKGRRDEDERLENEISLAFGDEGIETEEEESESDEIPLVDMKLENDSELLSNMSHYPGWLVEGFWTRRSHGMVSGEPKSFKSTVVLDLAISVASGKPFLGKFPVVDKGPVLIIQNENAGWIMKDRVIKIRNSKGLVGRIQKLAERRYRIEWPEELPIYYLNQQGFNFNDPAHREILENLLKKLKPKLVIFDPLYLMFEGDVNSSKELNPVLSWLLMVKEKYQISVLVVHHWKKNTQGTNIRAGQRMLGSTTLHGWVESAWYLEVHESDSEEREEEEKEAEGDSDILNTPGAEVKITLEREFRGAGTYPKIDLVLKMGEFGSTDYSVELSKHTPQRKDRKKRGPSEADLKDELRSFLSMKKGSVPIRLIAEELGISKQKANKLLKEIFDERKQHIPEVID